MPQTTEQQLRQEIWTHPTDPQLLSVYADWLVSEGDAPRAEFIQLSLLAKPTPAQNKRMVALRNKHRGAWLGAARPFIWTWEEDEDSPGFVRKCQCQMAKLTKGFEHVRALGPRLVVAVTAPKAKRETIALAKRPLGSLWGLALYETDAQWITDELMETLAPALRGLRELRLHPDAARSSDRGFAAVLEHIGSVERLDLTIGENPERWLERLVAKQLPKLQTVSLPGWIDKSTRKQLAKLAPNVVYRPGETFHHYNRETGFYE